MLDSLAPRQGVGLGYGQAGWQRVRAAGVRGPCGPTKDVFRGRWNAISKPYQNRFFIFLSIYVCILSFGR